MANDKPIRVDPRILVSGPLGTIVTAEGTYVYTGGRFAGYGSSLGRRIGPPRFLTEAEKRRIELEARKRQAHAKLQASFGKAPTTELVPETAPTRETIERARKSLREQRIREARILTPSEKALLSAAEQRKAKQTEKTLKGLESELVQKQSQLDRDAPLLNQERAEIRSAIERYYATEHGDPEAAAARIQDRVNKYNIMVMDYNARVENLEKTQQKYEAVAFQVQQQAAVRAQQQAAVRTGEPKVLRGKPVLTPRTPKEFERLQAEIKKKEFKSEIGSTSAMIGLAITGLYKKPLEPEAYGKVSRLQRKSVETLQPFLQQQERIKAIQKTPKEFFSQVETKKRLEKHALEVGFEEAKRGYEFGESLAPAVFVKGKPERITPIKQVFGVGAAALFGGFATIETATAQTILLPSIVKKRLEGKPPQELFYEPAVNIQTLITGKPAQVFDWGFGGFRVGTKGEYATQLGALATLALPLGASQPETRQPITKTIIKPQQTGRAFETIKPLRPKITPIEIMRPRATKLGIQLETLEKKIIPLAEEEKLFKQYWKDTWRQTDIELLEKTIERDIKAKKALGEFIQEPTLAEKSLITQLKKFREHKKAIALIEQAQKQAQRQIASELVSWEKTISQKELSALKQARMLPKEIVPTKKPSLLELLKEKRATAVTVQIPKPKPPSEIFKIVKPRITKTYQQFRKQTQKTFERFERPGIWEGAERKTIFVERERFGDLLKETPVMETRFLTGLRGLTGLALLSKQQLKETSLKTVKALSLLGLKSEAAELEMPALGYGIRERIALREKQKQVSKVVVLPKTIPKLVFRQPTPPFRPPRLVPAKPLKPVKPKPKLEPPRKPFGLVLPKREGKIKPVLGLRGQQAFAVLVKRFGKYRLVGRKLPRGKALALGKKITAETAARTFKLVPMGKTFEKDIPYTGLGKMFRYGIKKGLPDISRFVEKTRYAIDLPKEKFEIPYKALRLRRLGLLKTKKRRKRRKKK